MSKKTETLLLNQLDEVEITELTGSQHEVAFIKQLLFNWATVLKGLLIVTFNSSVTETLKAWPKSFTKLLYRAEIYMEFYMFKHTMKVLYVPEKDTSNHM